MEAGTERTAAVIAKDIDQAIDALEFSVELLERSSRDERFWRWTVLSLHQTAQGFMVCALAGTDGTRPLNHKRKDVRRYIKSLINRQYYKTGKLPTMPPNALDTFLGLYDKVKNPQMMQQYVGTSHEFVPPAGFDDDMRALNEYRNRFQHFTPGTWIVPAVCFVEPARAALRLVSFLAFESGNIVWQKYPARKKKVRSLLEEGKKAVGES